MGRKFKRPALAVVAIVVAGPTINDEERNVNEDLINEMALVLATIVGRRTNNT